MTIEQISLLISLLAMIFSVMYNSFSKKRADDTDMKAQAKREATIEVMLKNIADGQTNLNARFDKFEQRSDERFDKLEQRITKLERESIKRHGTSISANT